MVIMEREPTEQKPTIFSKNKCLNKPKTNLLNILFFDSDAW